MMLTMFLNAQVNLIQKKKLGSHIKMEQKKLLFLLHVKMQIKQ